MLGTIGGSSLGSSPVVTCSERTNKDEISGSVNIQTSKVIRV